MATCDFRLAPPPTDARARELWLQHAVGFILFEDVRGYARERVDGRLDESAREAAFRAIDDALYGVMMVLDRVGGRLDGDDLAVRLSVSAEIVDVRSDAPVASLDLAAGDGMCMGYHGWREGDFGSDPVVV